MTAWLAGCHTVDVCLQAVGSSSATALGVCEVDVFGIRSCKGWHAVVNCMPWPPTLHVLCPHAARPDIVGTNLALSKNAFSSSTYAGESKFSAGRAADGNTNSYEGNDTNAASFAHTQPSDVNPYWVRFWNTSVHMSPMHMSPMIRV